MAADNAKTMYNAINIKQMKHWQKYHAKKKKDVPCESFQHKNISTCCTCKM